MERDACFADCTVTEPIPKISYLELLADLGLGATAQRGEAQRAPQQPPTEPPLDPLLQNCVICRSREANDAENNDPFCTECFREHLVTTAIYGFERGGLLWFFTGYVVIPIEPFRRHCLTYVEDVAKDKKPKRPQPSYMMFTREGNKVCLENKKDGLDDTWPFRKARLFGRAVAGQVGVGMRVSLASVNTVSFETYIRRLTEACCLRPTQGFKCPSARQLEGCIGLDKSLDLDRLLELGVDLAKDFGDKGWARFVCNDRNGLKFPSDMKDKYAKLMNGKTTSRQNKKQKTS